MGTVVLGLGGYVGVGYCGIMWGWPWAAAWAGVEAAEAEEGRWR